MTVYGLKWGVYKTANGRMPFNEWLSGLKDRKTRAVIRTRLDRVAQGNLGHYKLLGDGVCELKISFGPGYRIYFGIHQDLVIILCGGDKSSQKDDIKRAKNYWKNSLEVL